MAHKMPSYRWWNKGWDDMSKAEKLEYLDYKLEHLDQVKRDIEGLLVYFGLMRRVDSILHTTFVKQPKPKT